MCFELKVQVESDLALVLVKEKKLQVELSIWLSSMPDVRRVCAMSVLIVNRQCDYWHELTGNVITGMSEYGSRFSPNDLLTYVL